MRHTRLMRLNKASELKGPLGVLLVALSGGAAAQPPGLPHIFSSGESASASEVNENFREVAPANVIHVNSGDELLEAMDPANAVYTAHGAPSADNPYLIRLAPGVYDLGTQYLGVPDWVSIAGAGRDVTVIRSGHSGSGNAVVRLDENSALRFMTVRLDTDSGSAYGVFGDSDTAVITHSDIVVNGATAYSATGVLGPAVVRHSSISVSGEGRVDGYSSLFGGPNLLQSVDITVSGSGSSSATGASMGGESYMSDVRVEVENSGSGAANGVGTVDGSATLSDSEVRVNATSGTATALYTDATLTVHRSTIVAGDGTQTADNVYAEVVDGGRAYLATSQLGGVYVVSGGGSIDCALVYSAAAEGFDGSVNTCPTTLD